MISTHHLIDEAPPYHLPDASPNLFTILIKIV